jgi:ectoine hydroxylase-related dioxygenase (phytanoyl-CoA dioxygenase family)
MRIEDVVTQEHIEEYSTDGVTLIRSSVGPEWIEKLTRGLSKSMADPSVRGRVWNRDSEGRSMFFDAQVWQSIPEYREFLENSPIAEVVGRAMGVSLLNFYYDAVFVRTPGSQFRTPFHQDEPFWSVKGFDCGSAWMPLVPVEKRSALEFVKGSHRWTEKFAQTNFGELTQDDRDNVSYDAGDSIAFPDIEGNRNDYEILSWDMEPGDMALFNARIIHGGSGLLSPDRDLKVFNTQWLGDDVRVHFRPEGMDPDHTGIMNGLGLKHGDRIGSDVYPELWRATRFL